MWRSTASGLRPSPSIEEAVALIRAWGEARDWRGYDPYDALNSPFASVLTLRTALGRRVLTQAVKTSPVNLRPLLRIEPAWNDKALALVASAYARLWAANHDETAAAEAARRLAAVAAGGVEAGGGLGWGYNFDVQTRFFCYRRGTPNTIASSFVAHALLDGCELLQDERWRVPADRAARFLETQMLVGGPRPYFRYVAGDDVLIHNANLLACSVLARASAALGDERRAQLARDAVRTSLDRQRPDGSWPYAESPDGGWVDNFHTGYVLESLARCTELATDVEGRLRDGAHFWRAELFLSDGTPRYSTTRTFPLDGHCYAEAVETWLALIGHVPDALDQARASARLLVERMLDPAGYVRFQQRRLLTSGVPFVRWTTAPSFRALAGLLLAEADGALPPFALRGEADARLD